MGGETWSAIGLTLRLATTTTVILLIVSTPLAWWLARTRNPWRHVVASVVTLPLVAPPTVLGFYLLVAMGPYGPLGALCRALGVEPLAFSFRGLVLGSVIYSLPFVVQPLCDAFESVAEPCLEAAATLGASPVDRFFTIAVPIARSGFLTASILGFAHTIGEFGVALMIGGNIPGQTRVLSIAIYNHVEAMEYAQAHWLAGGMVALSFALLMAMRLTHPHTRKVLR